MSNNFITGLIVLSVMCAFSLQAETMKAGAAVRVITPDPLLPVSGGVGVPKPATVKKGELSVRAMVLEKGTTRLAIVNVDNLGWPSVLGNKVRALVKTIPPENILIGATHTHSAPDAYGFADEKGNTAADLKYLDWCVQQMADAINEASSKLEPVDLKIAVAKAKGKIAFNYYAPKLYDPRCGVIQAVAKAGDHKGNPIVTLVNYAIHPEVIGSDRGILSPDLCGPLYDRIEQKTGGVALFMNSALGGMVTADTRREGNTEANDWDECIRIGQLLADEALRIIEGAPLQKDANLFCAAKTITFPIDSKMMQMIFKNSPFNYEMGDQYQVKTQLNLLNIGTAQVITIPGEALPNIGFFIKRKMKTSHPFLFGLTNDAFGYILTREDFGSFDRYDYISRTSLGEQTGEIYIEEVLKMIDDEPAAQQ